MNWGEEQNKLLEQLELLKQLRSRFGEEVIAVANNARLAVHIKWLEKLSINKSGRPSEIFIYSAFSVTSAIGYAMHCALDFGEAEAFSSDIRLKRTQILMQGDSYCDHCYERMSPYRKPQL
jgi:hypothetical protein